MAPHCGFVLGEASAVLPDAERGGGGVVADFDVFLAAVPSSVETAPLFDVGYSTAGAVCRPSSARRWWSCRHAKSWVHVKPAVSLTGTGMQGSMLVGAAPYVSNTAAAAKLHLGFGATSPGAQTGVLSVGYDSIEVRLP